jgi:hypothetical protein
MSLLPSARVRLRAPGRDVTFGYTRGNVAARTVGARVHMNVNIANLHVVRSLNASYVVSWGTGRV